MSHIISTFKSAIKNYLRVAFRYDNEATFRIFEPYVIYEYGENTLISGTQSKDYSKPSKEAVPHKFNLEKISSLRILSTKFEYDKRFDKTRNEYKDSIAVIKAK
jgi:predicted DNA-binding transcriptional regulator YafY